MKKSFAVAVAVLALTTSAFAATDGATLAVTGSVASSVSVSLATGSGGATVGGTANAGTLAMGSFARQSSISGWTKTSSANDFTFTTPVNFTIDAANTSSSAATVTAYMSSAPATGVTYSFGGTTVASSTAGSPTAIAGTTYTLDSTTQDYSADNDVAIKVDDNVAAGSISNTFNLTITVN